MPRRPALPVLVAAVALVLGLTVAAAPVAPVGAAARQTSTTLLPTSTTQAPLPVPPPDTTPATPPPTEPIPVAPTPEPTPDTTLAPTEPPPAGDGSSPTGDGSDIPVDTVPPPRMGDDAVALMLDDRVRTGDSSTAELLDALRPLTGLGFSETEAFVLGMGRFPVAGLATWSDDFHDPRYNPTPHLHQGNDIWTAFGTPVRAPDNGVVSLTDEVVGGKSAYVTTADGTYYYMTHLDGFPDDLSSGERVAVGQVVGYAGATGNAAGGPPHVHFEIRPGGGGAVNPKPILDQWVAEALAAAPKQASGNRESNPRIMLATGEIRRFDVPSAATSERAAKGPLLWSASVTSGGAVLRLAEVEAARMARRVDWTERAAEAQATAVDRHQAEQRARNLLSRLTPPGLRSVLDSTAS